MGEVVGGVSRIKDDDVDPVNSSFKGGKKEEDLNNLYALSPIDLETKLYQFAMKLAKTDFNCSYFEVLKLDAYEFTKHTCIAINMLMNYNKESGEKIPHQASLLELENFARMFV